MSGLPILVTRPDGSVGLVDERGKPMPAKQRIVITAGDLERALVQHAQAGIALGRRLGQQVMAEIAAPYVQAAATAGVKAGAEAGVKAGAKYVMDNSRVRRKVERDAAGQIVATVEEREPVPAADAPKPKKPIGFGR